MSILNSSEEKGFYLGIVVPYPCSTVLGMLHPSFLIGRNFV